MISHYNTLRNIINPQDRIDFFARHEHKCLVVWVNELKQEDILKQRIMDWVLI